MSSIISGIFLGIAIIVIFLIILKLFSGKREVMSYSDYIRDYGSVADKNPGNYSNHNDY